MATDEVRERVNPARAPSVCPNSSGTLPANYFWPEAADRAPRFPAGGVQALAGRRIRLPAPPGASARPRQAILPAQARTGVRVAALGCTPRPRQAPYFFRPSRIRCNIFTIARTYNNVNHWFALGFKVTCCLAAPVVIKMARVESIRARQPFSLNVRLALIVCQHSCPLNGKAVASVP